jgi:hypothetical protein
VPCFGDWQSAPRSGPPNHREEDNLIRSSRDASIVFATMLLCACTFTGHWLWAVGFAAVLLPWSFFGSVVEEHVLPWLMQWRIKRPDKWLRDAQGEEASVHYSR